MVSLLNNVNADTAVRRHNLKWTFLKKYIVIYCWNLNAIFILNQNQLSFAYITLNDVYFYYKDTFELIMK